MSVAGYVHNAPMTELLEQAFERIRTLPPHLQDEAARVLFRLVGDAERVIQLTPEEEADLLEAQAEMERGDFASEAEVEAVLSRYRL